MVLGDYFIGRHNWENVDKNTLPSDIPEVDEVGATSAPLLSASYFIGSKCKPYNDDFMLCKDENKSRYLRMFKRRKKSHQMCHFSVIRHK